MNELLAYRRERLAWIRFGSLALFLVLLGGGLELGRIALVGVAWLLVAVFRLRDDLADRTRDAIEHPDRVLVRARSTRPFELALQLGLAAGFVAVVSSVGLDRGILWIGLWLGFELAYRIELPGRHRWVLLKYPAFVALLGDGVGIELLALVYLAFAVFERCDDPRLRDRSNILLGAWIIALATVAAVQISACDSEWFAALVLVVAFATVRALQGQPLAIFLIPLLVWSHHHVGAPHARDPELLLLR